MRIERRGFETVHRLDLAGATAFLVIHATPYGRAFGGIRIREYPTDEHALDDACRLAQAMTRKVLLAGIPAGGAKTVVRLPEGGWPAAARTAGMARLGDFIELMDGVYHCGADLGFTADDEAALRTTTRHVAPRSVGAWTARSVLAAMRVVARPDSVAIQGLGMVGHGVAADLLRSGCRVVGADVSPDAGEDLDGLERVAPEAIVGAPCQVFSPCAGGGVLDAAAVERLRCAYVCGGANNPLADDAVADLLHARGIVYVPDVIASSGAVVKGASEALGEPDRIAPRLARLTATLLEVLSRARREDRSPHRVARDMADDLLVLARER